MPTIIYIHGFNSSAKSNKARILSGELAKKIGYTFVCPNLPYRPFEAIDKLVEIIRNEKREEIFLVGSSLGGFYATWLTEKYHCRSVLINPAINPHLDLEPYLGKQANLYTGHQYTFKKSYLQELSKLYRNDLKKTDLFTLIHTTGDELLNWKVAKKKFELCRKLIIQGGDHGFSEFGKFVVPILGLLG